MIRSFEEWWDTIPYQIRKKTRGNDKGKPLLNQLNYVFVHNNLQKMPHLNPSYAELMYWIETGQIEVMRKIIDQN